MPIRTQVLRTFWHRLNYEDHLRHLNKNTQRDTLADIDTTPAVLPEEILACYHWNDVKLLRTDLHPDVRRIFERNRAQSKGIIDMINIPFEIDAQPPELQSTLVELRATMLADEHRRQTDATSRRGTSRT
jgi:hypothetical protein